MENPTQNSSDLELKFESVSDEAMFNIQLWSLNLGYQGGVVSREDYVEGVTGLFADHGASEEYIQIYFNKVDENNT